MPLRDLDALWTAFVSMANCHFYLLQVLLMERKTDNPHQALLYAPRLVSEESLFRMCPSIHPGCYEIWAS